MKSLNRILLIVFTISLLSAQQISINRINLMPEFPSPYLMRDWKEVTIGYDSFVFDYNKEGQYLPLLFFRNNTVNYPDDISFGLHTVVGTTSPTSGEAINVIPAVVGATLVGIDKSNQNGYDWVKMCREFFNNRPEENVYLNHPSATSGDDWWYASMPNVFFYQLYDLYPETVDFDYQLRSVADQWLRAVETMGGSGTPWTIPNMNYRGWYLSTMTPHTTGVKEPEAAGALAWILYNAYKETGEDKYRIGAEWSMEFLNNYPTNPSYELQLPYGIYIAAKMNAELGTQYNLEKMLNWTFDVGSLRNWGSVVGRWGGLDMHGLIGEVNGVNDYPFLMNTFQQAGALLPLLRYDDRFADALGKWMLNAANATRFFYPNYLPANKQDQDSEEWALQYDTNSYIGHEAIRQLQYGVSPYATGDAIAGGWGYTNLVLYGSSHVGIFGSIIDTTDIEGILKLDLLKTDFFRDEAYPTFLFYNPYDIDKTVSIDVGSNKDIYESTTNTFLLTGVYGITQVTIPARSYIVVITPNGGTKTYDYDKMLVNGVVVDYMSGQTVSNYPPRIKSLTALQNKILKNDSTTIYCTAVDRDGDDLQYQWSSDAGNIYGDAANIIWEAPNEVGVFIIEAIINDGKGESVFAQIEIEVVEKFNSAPTINLLKAEPRKVDLGGITEIECIASDNEGDEITYEWFVSEGFVDGIGTKINWIAPNAEGNYYIVCKVSDPDGESSSDSIAIAVRDFSITQAGDLILFLPFNGNAQDESGNNNDVTVNGAVLTSDRFGNLQSAYKFDGVADNMRVTNSTMLNFSNSITVNFWIYVDQLYDREQYPISHGNWEQRWKVSISNNKIRWTINTTGGITDLDSESSITKGRWYNITGYYSGQDMELYINGRLDAFKYFNGGINSSSVDLTLGQTVPNNTQYNFNGKIDDVRLFDYAISYEEIVQYYDIETSVYDRNDDLPLSFQLLQNYPNPFNSQTNITFRVKNNSLIKIDIYNVLGQKVVNLVNDEFAAGQYSIDWDGRNNYGTQANSGIYFIRMKAADFNSVIKAVLLN